MRVVSGFLHEPLGGDEHPLGDTSKIGSIFGVVGFLGCFDRGKHEI